MAITTNENDHEINETMTMITLSNPRTQRPAMQTTLKIINKASKQLKICTNSL